MKFSFLFVFDLAFLPPFLSFVWVNFCNITSLESSVVDPDPKDLDRFWAIPVWIRNRILPSTSKKSKKNLDFYCFVTFGFFIYENL
jgi:hypothetical protein